ncbi:MAG: PIG-L family deacetylase [Phycisphaerae bacterium]|nr:PIG-L family deacetylase [Phycisphaerae bacterium]
MQTLELGRSSKSGLNILCLGAHGDDIEIGCGGTLLKWLDQYENVSCRWVVFSANPDRRRECAAGADLFLQRARQKTVDILTFRDGFMPFQGIEVKEYFERLKTEFAPDVIFTHYLYDRHQDHRLVCDLTWNTFRGHLILEYEVPKYDGDFGQPNVFVPLDEAVCRRKIDALLTCFPSQRTKRWYSEETFRAVLQLRAMEAGLTTGYAEAFYGRKVIVGDRFVG